MNPSFVVGAFVLFLLLGCQAPQSVTPIIRSPEYQSRAPAAASLFDTDEAVLRGLNIEQILNSKVVIPKKARLAILEFGRSKPWQWWSEELARFDEDIRKGAMVTLQNCQRLADVSLLPSLMVPEKQTIPYLREAGARYQADLLLVYRTGSRTYDKYRFLSPDESKAKCVVEAILLDVRSGIVPFSSVSSQEYIARRTKGDYSFSETVAKAEMKAISLGLEKVSGDLKQFLEKVP